jgi:hypothetical protein
MHSEMTMSKPDGTELINKIMTAVEKRLMKTPRYRAHQRMMTQALKDLGPDDMPLMTQDESRQSNKQFIAALGKRVQELHAEHRTKAIPSSLGSNDKSNF